MGASCGDCSRTRQHHCENDLRRPARTGGPESADKRQPSAFLLPATPRPRGNAGFLTIIPRQAPPAEKEPRPSQPCGVHRRAWRHHPGRRPQPFPQLRQCPGAAKGSPRAKSLRAQKHAENTRNGAQKRTRLYLIVICNYFQRGIRFTNMAQPLALNDFEVVVRFPISIHIIWFRYIPIRR